MVSACSVEVFKNMIYFVPYIHLSTADRVLLPTYKDQIVTKEIIFYYCCLFENLVWIKIRFMIGIILDINL